RDALAVECPLVDLPDPLVSLDEGSGGPAGPRRPPHVEIIAHEAMLPSLREGRRTPPLEHRVGAVQLVKRGGQHGARLFPREPAGRTERHAHPRCPAPTASSRAAPARSASRGTSVASSGGCLRHTV